MFKPLSDILQGNHQKKYKNYTSSNQKNQNGIAQSWEFIHLIKDWPKIVGENIAKNTVPVAIDHDKLIVLTKHSTYGHELSYMQQAILDKIFSRFPSLKGTVSKISFNTNENYFKKKEQVNDDTQLNTRHNQTKNHKFSPDYLDKKEKAENYLQESLEIEDEEIKSLLTSITIQFQENLNKE